MTTKRLSKKSKPVRIISQLAVVSAFASWTVPGNIRFSCHCHWHPHIWVFDVAIQDDLQRPRKKRWPAKGQIFARVIIPSLSPTTLNIASVKLCIGFLERTSILPKIFWTNTYRILTASTRPCGWWPWRPLTKSSNNSVVSFQLFLYQQFFKFPFTFFRQLSSVWTAWIHQGAKYDHNQKWEKKNFQHFQTLPLPEILIYWQALEMDWSMQL